MAKMIPDFCVRNERDKEYLIYEALKELPDDFTVYHNFRIYYVENRTVTDCECDFLVFHPQLGFLSIEAKWGQHIYVENGMWHYSDGSDVSPFKQANNESKTLLNYLNYKKCFPECAKITDVCKLTFAVWFHGMDTSIKNKATETPDSDSSIILTKEDLLPENTEKAIRRLYDNVRWGNQKTNLNAKQVKLLRDTILDCQYDWFATYSDTDAELEFMRLLKEQTMCLDFMKHEKTVTVIGGAGTGKTVLALEQAKRLAKKGENVLFMCYNVMLKHKLTYDVAVMRQNLQCSGIVTVVNIDEFTAALAHDSRAYGKAAEILGDAYLAEEEFVYNKVSYKHVIIDEGQDFGQGAIESSRLLENLQLLVTSKKINGSFVAFFDKKQFLYTFQNNPGAKLPKVMENSFCRIPLKTNCRNTRQIANTIVCGYVAKEDKLNPEEYLVLNNIQGKNPVVTISSPDETTSRVKNIISGYLNNPDIKPAITRDDIVILTLKTENDSVLANSPAMINGKFDRCLFTTARKFKGLERKIVILVDFDRNAFSNEEHMNNFYVGSSRARMYLDIVTSITDSEAQEMLIRDFKVKKDDLEGEDPKEILFGDIMGALVN